MDAAEPEFAAASSDDEALDPASGSGRRDVEEQPVAVRVPSWRGGRDEGGREGLVGVAASGLGPSGFWGGVPYSIHPSIVYGKEVDFARCPDRLEARVYE